MNTKLKSDRFRRARGGWARVLRLRCAACGRTLFDYQKDGPGPIKRLYLDRISPTPHVTKSLVCPGCKTLLGTHMIYKKERRPAFRMYQNAIIKK